MTRQIQDIAKPHLPAGPWVSIFALTTQKEAATYLDKNQSPLPNQRAGGMRLQCIGRRAAVAALLRSETIVSGGTGWPSPGWSQGHRTTCGSPTSHDSRFSGFRICSRNKLGLPAQAVVFVGGALRLPLPSCRSLAGCLRTNLLGQSWLS